MYGAAGDSNLAVKPRNTVALAGDRVVLRCASDRSVDKNNPISWTVGTRSPNCRPRREHCDLVIDSVRPSDAGGYDCTDANSNIAQASLIVIGKHRCKKNVPEKKFKKR